MTQNKMTTPLDDAEFEVKRGAISLIEALLLAKTLGIDAVQNDDRTYFGPDLSYSMLNLTNLPSGSGSYLTDPGQSIK